MPNDLRSLAADPNDGSKLLFGDNLDKRIQDINTKSNIKCSLATNGQGKKVHTHPAEVRKIPISCINVSIIQKTSTVSTATKKPRLGEASTQKEAGFIKKKNILLEVTNANCEFGISVHILRQKLDQYVSGNISNHFAQWVKITKDSFCARQCFQEASLL